MKNSEDLVKRHYYQLYDAETVDRLVRALADKDFDIVRLRGEVERLRGERDYFSDALNDAVNTSAELRKADKDEIERLQAKVKEQALTIMALTSNELLAADLRLNVDTTVGTGGSNEGGER